MFPLGLGPMVAILQSFCVTGVPALGRLSQNLAYFTKLHSANFQQRCSLLLTIEKGTHQPGVPGTPGGTNTRWDKQAPTARCPREFLLLTPEKLTEKGIFAGTPTGCFGDTGGPGAFQILM